MVHLIKKGVITGEKKTLHPRKHVFTVAQGDQEMLEFMNQNPAMESYPCSYVNNPAVIAKNDRMISINSLIQVDLLGQCNAEYTWPDISTVELVDSWTLSTGPSILVEENPYGPSIPPPERAWYPGWWII